MPRFFIGGLSQETNCFVPYKTGIRPNAFHPGFRIYEGEEILDIFPGTNSTAGGYIEFSKMMGIELVPTIIASGGAGGIVTKEAFDYSLERIHDGIKDAGKLDGAFVVLHGGCISEEVDDVEGHILKEVRELLGPKVPIVTTLDLHGHISPLQVEMSTVLNGYDTYPHVDPYERGFEAAKIAFEALNGWVKPVQVLKKPRVLPNLLGEYTGRDPMKALIEMAHNAERQEGVLCATINGGFPECDSPTAGLSIVVTTDNNLELAERLASEMEDFAWTNRKGFFKKATPMDDAIAEALRDEYVYAKGPWVLTQEGDSAGSGSVNDGTSFLKKLIEAKVPNTVVAPFGYAPEAVKKAIEAGVGNTVTVTLGGIVDDALEVTGKVITIFEGTNLSLRDLPLKSVPRRMGRTVVLKVDDIEIMLTELRVEINNLEAIRAVGIEPLNKKIVVLKSPVHFRTAFEPVAKKIIEVWCPGWSDPNLRNTERFPWKNIRRPIYPLDDI